MADNNKDKDKDEEECLLFGVDVEKAGRNFEHSLLAIGAVVLSLKQADIVGSGTWCIGPPDDDNWEQRCIDEFWRHNTMVRERIRKQGTPKSVALQSFGRFLQIWEAKVKPSSSPGWQGGTILVSDAPSFDGSMLDYEFQLSKNPVLNEAPIHYTRRSETRTTKWRDFEDCSERAAALGLDKAFFGKFFLNHGIAHTHWPSDDAAHHAWKQAICYAVTEFLRLNAESNVSRKEQLESFMVRMDDHDTGKRFVCDLALDHFRTVNS